MSLSNCAHVQLIDSYRSCVYPRIPCLGVVRIPAVITGNRAGRADANAGIGGETVCVPICKINVQLKWMFHVYIEIALLNSAQRTMNTLM